MAADRGPYIDHTQSMNLYFAIPSVAKICSALTIGWELGLKTGSYYLRSKPAVDPTQITLETSRADIIACSLKAMREGGECLVCQ